MSNNFFSFQEFTIKQEHCAMKVTTEASLFGAWVANRLMGKDGRALDIGTGTGLLSLMVAQETGLTIDAIEIDDAAALQASENFSSSPFSSRIKLIHKNLLQFDPGNKYDFIITNPPFYENYLSSPDRGKQIAHHGESLNLMQLTRRISELLKEEGTFYLLFPSLRKEELLQALKSVWLYATDIVYVFNDERKKPFRIIVRGGKSQSGLQERNLYIRKGSEYSEDFRNLMLPYYLPQALQQNQKDNRSAE